MLAAALAAALSFSPADAGRAFSAASALVERHTPRDAGTRRGRLAAEWILDSASAAGLDARLDVFTAQTPKGMRSLANVEARLDCGDGGSWAVLVSHFDTKPGTQCPGANDGASTTGLLLALAESAASQRLQGVNILFIWTDGEECMESYAPDDGLWGARRAAARLAESGLPVAGVICLDMLGDRDLAVSVPRNSTPSLAAAAVAAARSLPDCAKVAKSSFLVKDDHVPFLERGFPAIDLIDFDYGPEPGSNAWWHTPEDTMDKVSEKSLLAAGRLAAALACAICRQAREKNGTPTGVAHTAAK